jgi:glutamine synthetase
VGIDPLCHECRFRLAVRGKAPLFRRRTALGGDANPHLADSAILAASLAGVCEDLDCGTAYQGNASHDETLAEMPHTRREAVELLL